MEFSKILKSKPGELNKMESSISESDENEEE